jgi:hypothetical protein
MESRQGRLLGQETAANPAISFDHKNLNARSGQITPANEAVVTAADDDRIKHLQGSSSCMPEWLG